MNEINNHVWRSLTFLMLIVGLAASPAVARHRMEPIKVLILAPDTAPTDDSLDSSLLILEKELTGSTLFQVTTFPVRNNAADLTALTSKITSSRVIILDNVTRNQLMDLSETVKHVVAAGGGLIMIGHSQDAIDFVEPKQFGEIAPDSSPSIASAPSGDIHTTSSTHPIRVIIQDSENPIVKGMPRSWMHVPEELDRLSLERTTNFSVLATASYDPADNGKNQEPVMWVRDYGKGRVFGTEMGDDLEAFRCVGFITTLQRATEWAATGHVTQKLPDTFPSENTLSERADAFQLSPSTDAEFLLQFHRVADSTLSAMRQHAESIGVKGVALIAFFNGDNIASWISEMAVVGTFKRDPTPTADTGMNLLAVAYSKAAEMADTLKDSGSKIRPPMTGEFGWPGGVIVHDSGGYLLIAFSGGKQDQDVSIARAGKASLERFGY
jgi:hypothetical protein